MIPSLLHPHLQARKRSLASLQPRLQLWLGRMGAAAAGLLAAPLLASPQLGGGAAVTNRRSPGTPWDAERRVSLEVPFVGFEDLAARPKVCLGGVDAFRCGRGG